MEVADQLKVLIDAADIRAGGAAAASSTVGAGDISTVGAGDISTVGAGDISTVGDAADDSSSSMETDVAA
jgi:hypothetical protein